MTASSRASGTLRRALFLRPSALGAVLVAVVFAIYANTLQAPFLFDDEAAILLNPSIRELHRLDQVLAPPDHGTGVTARPIVNLSLAINYALGEYDPAGYHALNIAIHALAALALFGLVRRTLELRVSPSAVSGENPASGDADHTLLAGAIALLWAVHPLLTESVACVIQRTESLVGLFYLLTVYAFARGAREPARSHWFIIAFVACLAGMATKEVMVTAPVMVFLYDRTFVAGTFAEAWRRRRAIHVALAATWLLLAVLVIGSGGQRGGTVGFGLGASTWSYLLTQAEAIVMYLKLAVWPDALVLDHGRYLVDGVSDVVLEGLLVLALLGATIFALRRRPQLAFLGCWFFIILAPSSSVLPLVTQTIAEHRMYLPLAAIVSLVVLTSHRLGGRRVLMAVPLAATVLAWLTVQRNGMYADPVALWTDTVAKRPDNGRAHGFLGSSLVRAGLAEEAIPPMREAARLEPERLAHLQNLAITLEATGRREEAIEAYRQVLQKNAGNVLVRMRLASALEEVQPEEALSHYRRALRDTPGQADAHAGIARVLLRGGESAEAIEQLRAATAIRPDDPELHYSLGNALAELGRFQEALAAFETAVELAPRHAAARNNLGTTLLFLRRPLDAAAAFRALLEVQPDDALAHANLGQALLLAGDSESASAQFKRALSIDPDCDVAHLGLDRLRSLRRRSGLGSP